MRSVAGIRAACFKVFLHPRFGEHGGHMVGPVAHRRQLAGKRGQLTTQKIAKALAQRVDVFAVAVDKIHRHIQHPIDIALIAHAGFKRERQHAGAAGIKIAPDARAPAFVAVGLALEEGGTGAKRGGHRLQRQRHAQLLHHVGFRPEIEVHLHGAGAIHHLGAVRANLAHVIGHQPVAALGHARHLVMRPDRRGTDAGKAHAHVGHHLGAFAQVVVKLGGDGVHIGHRRARKLQLATGFKADVGAVAGEADDCALLKNRRPAEARLKRLKDGADAARPVIGQWQQAVGEVAELLVLGADAPRLARLFARGHIGRQLLNPLNRSAAALLGNGHRGGSGVLVSGRVGGARPRPSQPRMRGLCHRVCTEGCAETLAPAAADSRAISMPGSAAKAS